VADVRPRDQPGSGECDTGQPEFQNWRLAACFDD